MFQLIERGAFRNMSWDSAESRAGGGAVYETFYLRCYHL